MILTPIASDLLVVAVSNGENLTLARRVLAAGRAHGWDIALLDLTSLELPLFTAVARDRGLPAKAAVDLARLQAQLGQARAWCICTPEYNGSIPPALTSAFAWLSQLSEDFRTLFNGRPVALATHSGGPGLHMLGALRIQLAHLGADVVGRQISSNAAKPAADASIEDLLQRLMAVADHGPGRA